MNQILVSEKIYVTKEMKRKRVFYKTLFYISLITFLLLLALYIYIDIDKNRQEALGQEILAAQEADNTTVEEQAIVFALDDNEEDNTIEQAPIAQTTSTTTRESEQTQIHSAVTTSDGNTYQTDGVFEYPKLGINYSVLSSESESLLKVSLCKYWGPKPNEIGNYCIVGHNYRSGKMFGKLKNAEVGDKVKMTDLTGRILTYVVYNKYVVEPTDVSCTSQLTDGKKELTLITCTQYGARRLVVKCREV